MTDHNSKEEILKFPCAYPVKVMGKVTSSIENTAVQIIQQFCPEYDGQFEKRLSRDGNYIALTFIVPATSREQLDDIYRALSKHEDVLMAL